MSEVKSEPEPAHSRQLLLAKYVYQSGITLLDPALPMSCGLAISMSQDAVELLIAAVASYVDAPIKENMSFAGYWDVVPIGKRNPDKRELPFRANMLTLNKARVNFKHHGTLPAIGEAERFSAHTEQFLRDTTRLFFDRDFDDISMVDLVRNEKVRGKLKEAEAQLAVAEFGNCINSCAVAEKWVSSSFEYLIHRVDSGPVNIGSALAGGHQGQQVDIAIRRLLECISQIRAFTIANLAGRRLSDFAVFVRIAPTVQESFGGSVTFVRTGAHKLGPLSKEDAVFCLRYVTDFAIQAQDRI